jgi:hypothetical protein
MTPREAWLEMQYLKLKGENEYLKQASGQRYSMAEPPETLYMDRNIRVLQLAAECRAVNDVQRDGLHVMVRSNTTEFGETSLKYFVSNMALYTARDRAAVMTDMHKKVVFDIGRHLWDVK